MMFTQSELLFSSFYYRRLTTDWSRDGLVGLPKSFRLKWKDEYIFRGITNYYVSRRFCNGVVTSPLERLNMYCDYIIMLLGKVIRSSESDMTGLVT